MTRPPDPETILTVERDELRTSRGFMLHRPDVRYCSRGENMDLISNDGPTDAGPDEQDWIP